MEILDEQFRKLLGRNPYFFTNDADGNLQRDNKIHQYVYQASVTTRTAKKAGCNCKFGNCCTTYRRYTYLQASLVLAHTWADHHFLLPSFLTLFDLAVLAIYPT